MESGVPLGPQKFNIDEWEPQEPLFMTNVPDSTIDPNPALMAIQSLVFDDQSADEIAENFKEQGNSCFTRGKRFYVDSLKFYTQAIEQPVKDPKKRSVYFSNRAAVNLQIENYGKVVSDCDQAISLDPNNIKAYFRATKATYALTKYQLAVDYCIAGLKIEPGNKTLEREKDRAEKKIADIELTDKKKKVQESEINLKKRQLQEALDTRGIVIGPYLFEVQNKETTKVYLDDEGKLHWPVMFVYEEYSQVEYVEDFHELATFDDHLQIMFPPNEFPDWDVHKKYSVPDIEIYTILNQVTPLNPEKNPNKEKRPRKIKINHSRQLLNILQHEEYVVPGTPVFYLISGKSNFKQKFLKMSIDSLMKLSK